MMHNFLTLPRLIFICLVFVTVLSVRANAQVVSHPLDALTAAEVTRAVTILKNAGLADKDSRFASIALAEPLKKKIWAWKPGMAFDRIANLVYRRGPKTFRAVIDVKSLYFDLPDALLRLAKVTFPIHSCQG